jgi:serine phosphatase RsbU (regulator of sigma subunit)
MKLRRLFYAGGAFLLVLVKFTIDVIGKNVELEVGGLSLFRELTVIGAFTLLYLLFDAAADRREGSPVRKLGFVLMATAVLALVGLGLGAFEVKGFDAKNHSLVPLDYPTVFVGSLVSVAFGLYGVMVFRLLRDLTLTNRKPVGRRNYLLFTIVVLAAALSTSMTKPLDSTPVTTTLFVLAVLLAVVNAFRLPWIVYLSKREKVFSLLYGALLFGGCMVLNVMIVNSFADRALRYYSYPLREYVQLVCIFAQLFAGMTFVSTLFHLPTAEAFDRKRSEVSSLHTLSKLVTQVFDFNELVDTVTSMTLQVVEASRCWLEVIHAPGQPGVPAALASPSEYSVTVAGMKNITREEIDLLVPAGEGNVRELVMHQRKPLVVDDIERDPRFAHLKQQKGLAGSLVVVPLVSHTGLAGILYATKKESFGFVKDDVDVIAAFADQATVAIENSRLIRESLERERLYREMLVAQEMQKKLLPQRVPTAPTLEIDAVSTPAFEVGGDYYDFLEFPDGRIGIVVGDVSGKGVSAAFYMSEMKGIFQALAPMYASPREFLMRANAALSVSIDKHSFVSLIYVIIDGISGKLTLARAGHCPMLHVRGENVASVRPGGIGMGLGRGATFDDATREDVIDLHPGDVCVLYTDGVTEARRGADEFGYDRLMDVVRESRGLGAAGIKDAVLKTVSEFTEQRANEDDLTLVVLKWKGPDRRG